jgi:hypothetical protein
MDAYSLAGGAVVWDAFEDGLLRRELETRLYQLEPVEILIPEGLSPSTRALVLSLGVNRWGQAEDEAAEDGITGSVRFVALPPLDHCVF